MACISKMLHNEASSPTHLNEVRPDDPFYFCYQMAQHTGDMNLFATRSMLTADPGPIQEVLT